MNEKYKEFLLEVKSELGWITAQDDLGNAHNIAKKQIEEIEKFICEQEK